jgi:hypothetical protein
MSYMYTVRSVREDQALSRAAAERHLVLQAMSGRSQEHGASQPRAFSRFVTWLPRLVRAGQTNGAASRAAGSDATAGCQRCPAQ